MTTYLKTNDFYIIVTHSDLHNENVPRTTDDYGFNRTYDHA